jgi:hypothetical protein
VQDSKEPNPLDAYSPVPASDQEAQPYLVEDKATITSERILLSFLKRQKYALKYLWREESTGNIELEIKQLQNTHIVIIVKDKSKIIRDAQTSVPSFSNSELVGRCIIEGLAPIVFDKSFNPDLPIHDIILVGMPKIVMPGTRKKEMVIAYKFRYSQHRAKLVVDWNEAGTPDEVDFLLRPTVWRL